MKRMLVGGGLAIVAIVALGIAWVAVQIHRHPRLEPYRTMIVPSESKPTQVGPAAYRVTYFGVSTLLFDDSETAFLTDGFFTRPRLLKLGHVSPNREVISAALKRAGISRLMAVIPVHSHYDHALDSAAVAELTGAMLVGSVSSANIGRGAGIPETRLRIVSDGEIVRLGRFTLTFVVTAHSPGDRAAGEITEPLVPPVRANAYKTGTCYSVFVEHSGHSVLVQSSAGFVPGALKGHHAETVFLGIGGLGKQTEIQQRAYWQETVRTVGAQRVLLIHWDDFWKPLDEPLAPMPRLFDDFDESLRILTKLGSQDRVAVQILLAWMTFDPLASRP